MNSDLIGIPGVAVLVGIVAMALLVIFPAARICRRLGLKIAFLAHKSA